MASIRVRRAVSADASVAAELLAKTDISCFFGEGVDLKSYLPVLIETSYLAVVALSEEDSIVAYATFDDSPPATTGRTTEEFLETLRVGIVDFSAHTPPLFLTSYAAAPEAGPSVLELILQTTFTTLPGFDAVLLAVPIDSKPPADIKSIFAVLQLREGADPPSHDTFLFDRKNIVPDLRTRDARVEDYDDLVRVFDEQSEVLSSVYGQFFLADLVESQDEENKAIVAETDGHAVGLMCLSSDVEVDVLQDAFMLDSFDNLVKKPLELDRVDEYAEVAEAPNPEGKEDVESASLEIPAEGKDADDGNDDEEVVVPDVSAKTSEVTSVVESKDADGEDMGAGVTDSEEKQSEEIIGSVNESKDEAPGDTFDEANLELGLGNVEEVDVEGELTEMVEVDNEDIAHTATVPGAEVIVAESNAFAVTLFCLDEQYDSRARDLLFGAFERFPDRDYCVLTLPHTARETQLISYFTPVAPRPGGAFTHALYILHRDVVSCIAGLGNGRAPDPDDRLVVRRATKLDLEPEGVPALVYGLPNAQRVCLEVETCVAQYGSLDLKDDPEAVAFVVELAGQLAGVCVVSRKDSTDEELGMLRRSFDLDAFIGDGVAVHKPSDLATVSCIVLDPLFIRAGRTVMREVLRLYRKSCLFFTLLRDDPAPSIVVDEFVQVRPRRLPGGSANFALFALKKNLVSEPKLVSNSRVVVVGGSEAALSMLQTLVLVPWLSLTRITLLADGGIPDPAKMPKHSNGACTVNTGSEGAFDANTLPRLALTSRISVLDARLVDIDRESKAVLLPEGGVLPYDFLVIACGLQDGTVAALGLTPERLAAMGPRAFDTIFSVGSCGTASRLVETVEAEHWASEEPIIVYGSTLEALTSTHTLITLGIRGERITLVQPFVPGDTSGPANPAEDAEMKVCTSDAAFAGESTVAEAVSAQLIAAGVRLVTGLRLSSVAFDGDGGGVSSATFETLDNAAIAVPASSGQHSLNAAATSPALGPSANEINQPGDTGEVDVLNLESDVPPCSRRLTHLPCGLLVCAATRDVDADVFAAVNETGLVYDGRLVVNAEFQTSDDSIFGAGTVTKFSKRLREPFNMDVYNSAEVGEAVASAVLRRIDPLCDTMASIVPPRFRRPKIEARGVLLPGGISYFRAALPGATLPMAALPHRTFYTNGTIQEEEKEKISPAEQELRFCKIVVDKMGIVESVTYAGHRPVSQLNLEQLVGLHIALLNGLEALYERGEITDLIDFLSEEWAEALYHDRFAEFCSTLQRTLSNEEAAIPIFEKLREAIDSGAPDAEIALKRANLVGAGGASLPPSVKRCIEVRLHSYLKEVQSSSLLRCYYLSAEGTSE